MTDDRPTITLGKNVPPVPKSADPREQRRLQRQAADFLRAKDPTLRRKKREAAIKRHKDALQAKRNPALVRARQKALRLKR